MAATLPVIDYRRDITSRPYIESSEVIWPRNDKNDAIHSGSPFAVNSNHRDFYVIHPDWTSESLYSPPKAPTDPWLVRRPWLWEYPRARELFYPSAKQQLRARVLREAEAEDRVPRLHEDPHYRVQHNSPWYVNNRREVRDSNPLEKVRPMPGSDGSHLRPWNSARRLLCRELANPVEPQHRLLVGQGASGATNEETRPMTGEEVARFRSRSRMYMTACDWS